MTKIKAFTDIQQSRKLAEILPLESADMAYYFWENSENIVTPYPFVLDGTEVKKGGMFTYLNCWSLAALLDVLSEIKPQVYTPILFPSEGKWILQFAEYGHGNVCEVTCDNPVDACVEIIIKLSKLKLL